MPHRLVLVEYDVTPPPPTVENPEHSDFAKLRNMLIRTHMQDLKEVTRDVHYENFRSQKLSYRYTTNYSLSS